MFKIPTITISSTFFTPHNFYYWQKQACIFIQPFACYNMKFLDVPVTIRWKAETKQDYPCKIIKKKTVRNNSPRQSQHHQGIDWNIKYTQKAFFILLCGKLARLIECSKRTENFKRTIPGKPYCVLHLYGFNDCILHGLLIIALFRNIQL